MSLHNLEDAFKEHLKDLYNAEKQLVAALPAMARGADDPGLRRAFEEHLEATEEHVTRLESVFELMGMPARGKTCVGMKGLIDEGKEVLAERSAGNGAAVDAALIAAAQKLEHYEISAYGSASAFADLLDRSDVAELLRMTLEEENEANDTLSGIAFDTVNPAAMAGAAKENDEADDDDDDEVEEDEDVEEKVGAAPAKGVRTGVRARVKPGTRSGSRGKS